MLHQLTALLHLVFTQFLAASSPAFSASLKLANNSGEVVTNFMRVTPPVSVQVTLAVGFQLPLAAW